MNEPDLNFSDIINQSDEKLLALADHFDAEARKATLLAVDYTESAKDLRKRTAS